MTPQRRRELRETSGLRQEDLATIFKVGQASINRWESDGRWATTPSGLPADIYEMLDKLQTVGAHIPLLSEILTNRGPRAAIHWIYATHMHIDKYPAGS